MQSKMLARFKHGTSRNSWHVMIQGNCTLTDWENSWNESLGPKAFWESPQVLHYYPIARYPLHWDMLQLQTSFVAQWFHTFADSPGKDFSYLLGYTIWCVHKQLFLIPQTISLVHYELWQASWKRNTHSKENKEVFHKSKGKSTGLKFRLYCWFSVDVLRSLALFPPLQNRNYIYSVNFTTLACRSSEKTKHRSTV